jgi:hypothetical protein
LKPIAREVSAEETSPHGLTWDGGHLHVKRSEERRRGERRTHSFSKNKLI